MRKFIYLALITLILCFIPKTEAATFTVSNSTDLIAAITAANTNGQADTITLTADIVLMVTDNVTDGNNGLPSILADGGNSLTIEGNGFTIRRGAGAASFRIMHIDAGANVFLNDLGIENGLANAGGLGTLGAGIYTEGSLTIDRGVFTGNTAVGISGLGAGILSNQANLTITNSNFSGNNAGGTGGAIYNYQNTATLTGNTFAGNTSNSSGGAIGDEYSNTTLINNTFSGNTATDYGGAIYRLGGTSLMSNNTITNNSASIRGGGINNSDGNITLHNNIIAGNTAPTGSECRNETLFFGAVMTANSYNIFGVSGSAGGCPAGATDIVPAGGIATVLLPLANNGGPTSTHALAINSPALDAANLANCPSTDQRGFVRGFEATGTVNNPQVGDCDIGAFEFSLDPAYDSNPPVGATIVVGTTPVGTQISTTLTIMEVGGAALTVNLNSITGPNAGDFSVIGLPTSIDDGDVPQTLAIFCTPSGAGLRTAQMTFNTNDPLQPTVSYDLECTGTSTVMAEASLLGINQVVTEANTPVTVTVQLVVPVGMSIIGNIDVEVVDAATGNAISGTDYTAFPPTTVTFAGPLLAGNTYTQNVVVNLLDDNAVEGAKALALRINSVTGSAEIAPSDSHTIVINDSDGVFAQASFVITSALVNEDPTTLNIDVQLFIPAAFISSGDVTLTISDALTGNAATGVDYMTFAPVTLTFVDAPFVVGTTYTQTVTLAILEDALVEGAETVELAITGISGPVELLSPATVTVIINDDELATSVITQPGGTETIYVQGITTSIGGDVEFVFKTVDNPLAQVGQTVTYTIRAHNPKTIPLTQVVIYDVFDARLVSPRLISTTHGAGVFDGNTLTVSGFTLQPSEEAIIVVSAQIGSLQAGEVIPNAAILESPDASVHVSNLALVGSVARANGGGAGQVVIIPGRLPATGGRLSELACSAWQTWYCHQVVEEQ